MYAVKQTNSSLYDLRAENQSEKYSKMKFWHSSCVTQMKQVDDYLLIVAGLQDSVLAFSMG